MSPLWCHQQGAGELLLLKGEGKVVLALGNPPVDGRWHRDMPSITLPPSGLRSRAKSSAPEPGAGDARPGTGRCFPGSHLQEKPCRQRAGRLSPFPSTARSCWRAGDGMGHGGIPQVARSMLPSRAGTGRIEVPSQGTAPCPEGTARGQQARAGRWGDEQRGAGGACRDRGERPQERERERRRRKRRGGRGNK